MPKSSNALYPFRRKMDGSTDLICLNCLTTVSAQPDEEFATYPHICHSFLTARTNHTADAAKVLA
ncbi:MAG: hypothetical protein ABI197_07250 [Granulicella sp.]